MKALALDKSKYNLTTMNTVEIDKCRDFLSAMLSHVVQGGTLASFYRHVVKSDYPKGNVGQVRLRLTLSVGDEVDSGVVALVNAYQRARSCLIESKFDELFDIYDTQDIKDDPRLASAAKGKSQNIQWALSKLNATKYGDKIQIEQSVDINIVDRLQAGRDRVAALDNDSDV